MFLDKPINFLEVYMYMYNAHVAMAVSEEKLDEVTVVIKNEYTMFANKSNQTAGPKHHNMECK